MSEPDVLIHHSVRGTHWMNAASLREEILEREPSVNVTFARTAEEAAAVAPDVDVLLSSFIEPWLLEEMSSLQWIQALSAGVDTLDVAAVEERGILLTSGAGAHAQPAAEQILGYMLTFERRFREAFENQRRGAWERYRAGELAGKTLGVIGLGEIGRRAAELADAVGMEVVGTKRDTSVEIDAVDRLYEPESLGELLVDSEYVLVSCPLTEETRGMLGRDEIGSMRDDAVLINVARGEIVDEAAMTEALQQRTIRGAALDVFEEEPLEADSPLWNLSNVIVTPHNLGSSPKLPARIAEIFVENYEAFLEGDPERMRNRVR